MTEADDHFFVLDALADVGLGLIGVVVAALHLERRFVGTAVLGAFERADRAADRGVHVGSGAAMMRDVNVDALNSCSA